MTALDVATAFLDAFTAGDFDRVGTFLADDFTFDGPIAHYRSAADFLTGSKAFADRIQPTWAKVAAFGDENEALLLYDLTMLTGARMRIADHFIVRDGRIQAEEILWDTHGARP